MKIFFYLPILICAFTYIYYAFRGSTIKDYNVLFKKYKETHGNQDAATLAWNETDNKYMFVFEIINVLFSLMLSFIGLLSFNWLVFALILFLQLVMSKAFRFLKLTRLLRFIVGSLYLFTALNSYHFQLNVFQLITNLF